MSNIFGKITLYLVLLVLSFLISLALLNTTNVLMAYLNHCTKSLGGQLIKVDCPIFRGNYLIFLWVSYFLIIFWISNNLLKRFKK